MSNSTIFRRVALAVVAALGMGVMSIAPTYAAASNESLTLSSASSSIAKGETATITATHKWIASAGGAAGDSLTIYSSCLASGAVSGGSATCPTLNFYVTATSDTAGVNPFFDSLSDVGSSSRVDYKTSFSESTTSTVVSANGTTSVKYGVRAVSSTSTEAGTYTYTILTKLSSTGTITGVSSTWTVTVTGTSWSGLTIWKSNDQPTFRDRANKFAATSDSSTNVSTGKADSTVAVAYVAAAGTNASGETTTAGGLNICTDQTAGYCAIGVVVDGPGLISVKNGTPAKSATLRSYNNQIDQDNEYLVIYSDGTAGVGTIKFYNAATLLASTTVTFTGAISNITLTLSDTSSVVAKGTTGYVSATVKDAAGNSITTGSIWLWSSDTSIVSETASACAAGGNGTFRCAFTAVDTGTVTLVARDSSTIGKSETVSVGVSVRVSGEKLQKVTATFDKATYRPGEVAVLTITGYDRANQLMDCQAISNAFVISTNSGTLGFGTANGYGGNSTNSSLSSSTDVNYTPVCGKSGGVWDTSAVETRVMFMPLTQGTFEYTIKAGSGSWTTVPGALAGMAAVTASAAIVDPTQVAQGKAIADAQAAADAATDAALQAIDAANAATDAANLAAEAADAATVAAEEAKDAADAATAAVESLATQVATLMAALQAQVRSLANTVAKIAKKVKA